MFCKGVLYVADVFKTESGLIIYRALHNLIGCCGWHHLPSSKFLRLSFLILCHEWSLEHKKVGGRVCVWFLHFTIRVYCKCSTAFFKFSCVWDTELAVNQCVIWDKTVQITVIMHLFCRCFKLCSICYVFSVQQFSNAGHGVRLIHLNALRLGLCR